MTLKNTENNAIIKIRNLQSAKELEDVTELTTEGKFYESGGKQYIFYTESEEESTKVMLVISGDTVTLSRNGEYSSKMHYRPGENDRVIYHTPFGIMTMQLATLSVENFLQKDGGRLNLVYRLTVNGEKINNNLSIEVRCGKEG